MYNTERGAQCKKDAFCLNEIRDGGGDGGGAGGSGNGDRDGHGHGRALGMTMIY